MTRSYSALFLVLSSFFMPLSTSLMNIFISLSVAAIVLTPGYWSKLKTAFLRPYAYCFLLFLVYVGLGCIWSHATWHDALNVFFKYLKLLYLPVFIVGLQESKTRDWVMNAFLLAMFVTCCAAWLKWVGYLDLYNQKHIAETQQDFGYVFKNHIVTGYLTNLAAYFTLLKIISTKHKQRLFYAALFVLYSYQVLFMGTGRMAYVTYFLLMSLFILQHVPKRKLFIVFFMFSISIASTYFLSSTMNAGFVRLKDEYTFSQNNERDNPIGFRFQFHDFAYDLFKRSPWIGQGTSGFREAFRKEQPIPAWGTELFEPHSQYWLIAAEGGIVGLILFFFSLSALSFECLQLKKGRSFSLALLTSFLLACVSDSFLLFAVTGLPFILLMAVCMGADAREPLPASRIVFLSRWILHRFFGNKPGIS